MQTFSQVTVKPALRLYLLQQQVQAVADNGIHHPLVEAVIGAFHLQITQRFVFGVGCIVFTQFDTVKEMVRIDKPEIQSCRITYACPGQQIFQPCQHLAGRMFAIVKLQLPHSFQVGGNLLRPKLPGIDAVLFGLFQILQQGIGVVQQSHAVNPQQRSPIAIVFLAIPVSRKHTLLSGHTQYFGTHFSGVNAKVFNTQ